MATIQSFRCVHFLFYTQDVMLKPDFVFLNQIRGAIRAIPLYTIISKSNNNESHGGEK